MVVEFSFHETLHSHSSSNCNMPNNSFCSQGCDGQNFHILRNPSLPCTRDYPESRGVNFFICLASGTCSYQNPNRNRNKSANPRSTPTNLAIHTPRQATRELSATGSLAAPSSRADRSALVTLSPSSSGVRDRRRGSPRVPTRATPRGRPSPRDAALFPPIRDGGRLRPTPVA